MPITTSDLQGEISTLQNLINDANTKGAAAAAAASTDAAAQAAWAAAKKAVDDQIAKIQADVGTLVQ